MQADTERELRHNLEEAQEGLVEEWQAHEVTKKALAESREREKVLSEELRQAYVVIQALNEQLALRS